jgi:hypothetical protein
MPPHIYANLFNLVGSSKTPSPSPEQVMASTNAKIAEVFPLMRLLMPICNVYPESGDLGVNMHEVRGVEW